MEPPNQNRPKPPPAIALTPIECYELLYAYAHEVTEEVTRLTWMVNTDPLPRVMSRTLALKLKAIDPDAQHFVIHLFPNHAEIWDKFEWINSASRSIWNKRGHHPDISKKPNPLYERALQFFRDKGATIDDKVKAHCWNMAKSIPAELFEQIFPTLKLPNETPSLNPSTDQSPQVDGQNRQPDSNGLPNGPVKVMGRSLIIIRRRSK